MARPLRILFPDAYYHVTCRGNERKPIYRDDTDRRSFIGKLEVSCEIYDVRIHAYVLMANHFHLIVQTPAGNLPAFMRHFNISYTAAFNRRHDRVGHLYQGRYKAILIDQDSYLLELSRYVHVNPIRVRGYQREEYQKQITLLKSYPWSSLSGYLSSQKTLPWVNYAAVLGYVGGSRKRYGEFLAEGIRKGYDTPWEKLQGQVVLGEDDFVERIKKNVSSKSSKREQPAMRHLARRDLKTIVHMVADYFRVPQDKLTGRRTGHRDERAIALELMYRYGAVSQARIGKLFALDYTAVSRERKRFRERTESNKRLRKQLREIEVSVLSSLKI